MKSFYKARLATFIFCSFSLSVSAATPPPAPISFERHKTQDALSQTLILDLCIACNLDTFVETGSYNGQTTQNALFHFDNIYTAELHQKRAEMVKKRFDGYSHVQVFSDTSEQMLKKILPSIKDKRILFWLDAHYSGAGTAMGKSGPYAADAITAIREELKAISKSEIKDCVILIDDIRGFGTKIDNKKYIGCWAYPTVQNICTRLKKINPYFSVVLIGDMLLAYDPEACNLKPSPVVQACTKSRLYDGTNYSEQEILEAEQVIQSATGSEKDFIVQLYQMMTPYKDPEFHHDLWYGLVCLGSKNHFAALTEFTKVLNRGYTDWRILWYAALAAEGAEHLHIARELTEQVTNARPSFAPAQELLKRLDYCQ